MGEEHSDTEAGVANDETQVISDGPQPETHRQAWSDAHDEDDPPERHPWHAVTGQAAALITAGAAVATVVAVLGWIALHKDRPAPAAPLSARAETTNAPVVAAPPPLATVTITAAPPTTNMPSAPPPAPTTTTSQNVYQRGSAYDKAYLDAMAQEGWGCVGHEDRDECGREMLNFAHQVCSYAPQSYSFYYQIFGLPEYFGPREMRRAIANASAAYPNCVVTGTP